MEIQASRVCRSPAAVGLQGMRMRKGRGAGMLWVSVSVAADVVRGDALCSMGPPFDVRRVFGGSGKGRQV